MSSTTTFQVRGMSCGHCVSAVETEVSAIPGVTSAHADLATGRLEITSDSAVDAAAVRAAVEAAGYEVGS